MFLSLLVLFLFLFFLLMVPSLVADCRVKFTFIPDNACSGLAQIAYYSFKVVQLHMLAEVTLYTGGAGPPRLCIRSQAPQYAPLALQLLEAALRQ